MFPLLVAAVLAAPPSGAVARHRAAMAEELLSKDGPLSIVGRLEVPRGHSTLGAAPGSTLLLATPAAPARFGVIDWNGRVAHLEFQAPATINGRPVRELDVDTVAGTDARFAVRSGKLLLGFVWSHLNSEIVVRVFDDDAPRRAKPVARVWYNENSRYRVTARWTPAAPGATILIHRADGIRSNVQVVGVASFSLDGKNYELTATGVEAGKLFFTFRDLTAAHETYGGGRFLYADAPRNGRVTLDFNQAINPNCAFAPWWSCPLPPSCNRLKVAIPAGEKIWPGASH
jgi:uncharacterized protein (DUF1684 family)